jgi:hypothetical protein
MLLIFGGAATSATSVNTTNTGATHNDRVQNSNRVHKATCARSFKRSLRRLYAISNKQSDKSQPENDFEKLYSKAHSAQIELENICHTIASITEAEVCISGIKSKQRALAKVNNELGGDPRKITDLARATLVAHDIESLVNIYQELDRSSDIVQVKNRFKQPTVSEYRDLNLLIRLPETGLIAEVQVHLEAIADVKNGHEHKFYEQIQYIERAAASEKRYINEQEQAQIQHMRQQSKVMYLNAWHPYISTKLRSA